MPASLLLACSHAPLPPKASVKDLDAEYLTIAPDVSVSRTAQMTEPAPVDRDPNRDVMSEILAIPPGR